MKLALTLLSLTASLYAVNYKGCADTKQNALFTLSGNIKSNIKSSFEENIQSKSNVSDEETVQTTINSYINASTNLSLANIHYTQNQDKTEYCASVESEDQVKNTQKLLTKVLLYKEKNLPKDINEKVNLLSKWIKDMQELEYLLPEFLNDSKDSQKLLNEKMKKFRDLYRESLLQANSLIWKSCAKNKEESKAALNKKLFIDKGQEEKKSFFSSILSVFDSKEAPLIDYFDSQISYTKKDKDICALIKKDELYGVTQKMYDASLRFGTKTLEKNPIVRYKQIQKNLKHLDITKKLLELFPKVYSTTAFNNMMQIKNSLTNKLKTTYPQSVVFNIKNNQNPIIKLDSKIIANNERNYIVAGEHSYTISTKGKCPIVGSFKIEMFDEKTISEDFSNNAFPSALFVTDKTPNIVLDGAIIKANVSTPIPKCEGTIRYLVRFEGQNRSGEFELSPNEKFLVPLNFLTKKELAIFNDAKSKNFDTKGALKFSESLTPLVSEKLKFLIEEKPSHGKVEIHEQGSFKYVADENYVGQDSFEYIIETDDKTSSPKIVNITVSPSAIITPKTVEKKKENLLNDLNATKEKIVENIEEKTQDIEEKSKEYLQKAEEKYNRFKAYVNSQEQNIEKLKKLQKTYPEMFERLLKEKIGQ